MSWQDVVDKVQQYIGVADYAMDVLPTLNAEIMNALIAAEADPTSANVEAVAQAYARSGQVPPAKLMAQLLYENEKVHPEDTVRGDLTPWLIGGALVLFLLFRRRR